MLFPLLIASCSKEQLSVLPIAQTNQESQILQRIKNLSAAHQNLVDPSSFKLSSLESMTVAEAIQIIEATSNFDFRHDVDLYEGLNILSYSTTIEKNELGIVDGEIQLEAYAQVFATIEETLQPRQLLIVCDVKVTNETASQVTATIDIVTAYPTDIEEGRITGPCDFNSSDNWFPYFDDGKCDGSFINVRDGSDRIESKIPCAVAVSNSCGSGQVKVYYNIVEVVYLTDMYWNGSGYERFHFYETDCNSPAQLLNNRDGCVYLINANTPSGKEFRAADILADVLVGGSLWSYNLTVKYANYFCTTIEG